MDDPTRIILTGLLNCLYITLCGGAGEKKHKQKSTRKTGFYSGVPRRVISQRVFFSFSLKRENLLVSCIGHANAIQIFCSVYMPAFFYDWYCILFPSFFLTFSSTVWNLLNQITPPLFSKILKYKSISAISQFRALGNEQTLISSLGILEILGLQNS